MRSDHDNPPPPHVVIACGGTGGHLYPGLAVGQCLLDLGATVSLMVSSKDVDQQALRGEARFDVVTLPAVGFAWSRLPAFLGAAWRSVRRAGEAFDAQPPAALLVMGGFTSAPPAWAARRRGCPVFLHEANAIPGRANRWLARQARRAYVYFPEAADRLGAREVQVVGMPVRREFLATDPLSCRVALGLDARRPVLLITGGSQGASGVNDAVLAALPELAAAQPDLQYLHLTGPRDESRVRAAYAQHGCRAVVRPFLTEMDLALGAAHAAVCRAGASSAAELAAVGLPAVLIPYPHSADGHQEANARALERTGAARVLLQSEAVPGRLVPLLLDLVRDDATRAALRSGLTTWHRADADAALAGDILALVSGGAPVPGRSTSHAASPSPA